MRLQRTEEGVSVPAGRGRGLQPQRIIFNGNAILPTQTIGRAACIDTPTVLTTLQPTKGATRLC